jgi:hypothetical protein
LDFFTAQDQARRRTRILVVLFGLSILTIVLLIYLPANLLLMGSRPGGYDPGCCSVNIALPVSALILAGAWWRLRSASGRPDRRRPHGRPAGVRQHQRRMRSGGS